MRQRIVILGGGVGGVVAANELRRRLPREVEISVIDRERSHALAASFLWVVMGWRRSQDISRDLDRLQRKGINFINAEVAGLDLENRVVFADGRSLDYDYLIIALGAELAPERVPGFSSGAHTFYSLEAAQKLRERLLSFSDGSVVILISSTPFKCPAAPYEAALLLDSHFRQGRSRGQVELQVFTPEALPMLSAGPELGKAVVGMLTGRGIAFHPNTKVSLVDPERREVIFEGDERVKYDLLIGIPPHHAPTVVHEAGLTNESGWIPVDSHTLKTKVDRVYALGDITSIRLPSGTPLPKAGVFAHAQAKVVAESIATELTAQGHSKAFDGRGSCFIEMGNGIAAYASGDFYAEPRPAISLHPPGRMWHWGKVFFEKYWFWRWF